MRNHPSVRFRQPIALLDDPEFRDVSRTIDLLLTTIPDDRYYQSRQETFRGYFDDLPVSLVNQQRVPARRGAIAWVSPAATRVSRATRSAARKRRPWSPCLGTPHLLASQRGLERSPEWCVDRLRLPPHPWTPGPASRRRRWSGRDCRRSSASARRPGTGTPISRPSGLLLGRHAFACRVGVQVVRLVGPEVALEDGAVVVARPVGHVDASATQPPRSTRLATVWLASRGGFLDPAG
jgi:hypothetical protein